MLKGNWTIYHLKTLTRKRNISVSKMIIMSTGLQFMRKTFQYSISPTCSSFLYDSSINQVTFIKLSSIQIFQKYVLNFLQGPRILVNLAIHASLPQGFSVSRWQSLPVPVSYSTFYKTIFTIWRFNNLIQMYNRVNHDSAVKMLSYSSCGVHYQFIWQ